MASRKTIEFRQMMGDREQDSDGFTYCYGKFNDYPCRARRKNTINRCRRNDKRAVKQAEGRRIRREEME